MPTTLADFEKVFHKLVEDLTAHCKQYGYPQNALEWYRTVCYERPHSLISLTDTGNYSN